MNTRSRLLPILFLAAGCAASGSHRVYEGERLPTQDVAILRTRSRAAGYEMRLRGVDGEAMDLAEWQQLELLPGEHALLVGAQDVDGELVPCAIDPSSPAIVSGGDPSSGSIVLSVEAGRSYTIEGRFAQGRCTAVVHTSTAPAPEPVASAVPTDRPYVLALGTAQDGGLPQIACEDACCAAARADPARRRLVCSLLLVDPRTQQRWLFEATPDLREQVERAADHPPLRALAGARPPLFEGIFLTHAHIGHYLGLAFLGREAYGTKGQRVYGSQRMNDYLAGNGPWSLMIEDGGLEVQVVAPGTVVQLAEDLTVEPILVPHRDEFSDTYAWLIRGPRRALLFLPDIDKWERWERPVEELIAEVDLALLDGSFYADGEVPGRSMAEIAHPFLVESIARFAPLSPSERGKVRFIHLNHTNPAADPESEAAGLVRAAGMGIVAEMERFEL